MYIKVIYPLYQRKYNRGQCIITKYHTQITKSWVLKLSTHFSGIYNLGKVSAPLIYETYKKQSHLVIIHSFFLPFI